MSKQNWARMVRGGENLKVEFKRQVPKLERLARSFSAFSNSSGGVIFFGIEDSGDICGLDSVEGTRDLVNQVAQFHCNPPLKPKFEVWQHVRGTEVLVVEIPEASVKPVYAVSPDNPKDTWAFFRSDKENLPLDRKSLKSMRRQPSVPVEQDVDQLDRHAINMLNNLSDNPNLTLNQLARSANISPHRAKKIIVHLERNGWIHCFFNEKRREYSLAIPWRKR